MAWQGEWSDGCRLKLFKGTNCKKCMGHLNRCEKCIIFSFIIWRLEGDYRDLHLFSVFIMCESETWYLAGVVCSCQREQQRTCSLSVCGAHNPENTGTFLCFLSPWRNIFLSRKETIPVFFWLILLLMIPSLIIISLLKWWIFSLVTCQSVAPTPITLSLAGKH